MMRRSFDILVAIFGLIFLSLVFIIIALLIKVHDRGPVFYRATRVGLNGKIFFLFKFRTMVTHADKIGVGVTSASDKRITLVGQFLRKYKLDEFPQLLNIICGEMNLVGPRPEDPRYTALYDSNQQRILNVLPGITSPASLYYKDEASLLVGDEWENKYIKEVMPAKLLIDLKYFENNSFFNDIGMIFKTVINVFQINLPPPLFFYILFLPSFIFSQSTILPLDQQLYSRFGKLIYLHSPKFHTSIQPYALSDFDNHGNTDSILLVNRNYNFEDSSWIAKKIFNEHLFETKGDGYRLFFDFLPDIGLGNDLSGNRSTWLNTRAFFVGGNIGSNFSFSTEFFESQSKFPEYIDGFVKKNFVIPGQGFLRPFGHSSYDYGYASGLLSFSPSRYSNFQFGHGKNFIGDGYRSLLLSDIGFNYPYFKMSITFWKLKYMYMMAQFQDIGRTQRQSSSIFDKKYGVFHFIDMNISDCLTIGLFETIIWKNYYGANYRGIELNYLNPIIFFRPVEYSIGSPDNVLMGVNIKYKIVNNSIVYGQFLIDEMTISEYFANRGYWANKYSVQLGTKIFEPLNFRNLYLQLELNTATPYTYSHLDPLSNYGHYNQSLAHPLGANFYESIGIASYSIQRYEIRTQINYAKYGSDSSQTNNVGQDIFKSYSTLTSVYGNYIGQGVSTNLLYADLKVAYVLNPITNLRFEVSCTYRSLTSTVESSKTVWFNVGIRSSFRNIYYDF